jgi:MFS superfamily sulfate permease-like transporter
MIALLKKVSAPAVSMLGRLPGTRTFVGMERYPEAAAAPGVLIFRPNGILFFANANRFSTRLRDALTGSEVPVREVIVSMEASPEIDVTVLDMLEQLRSDLSERGIRLMFARISEPVRELLRRSGFVERVGEANFFWDVDSAVSSGAKASQRS